MELCIAAPHTPNPAPTANPAIALGKRMSHTIWSVPFPSSSGGTFPRMWSIRALYESMNPISYAPIDSSKPIAITDTTMHTMTKVTFLDRYL